jgi:hypothetical protein
VDLEGLRKDSLKNLRRQTIQVCFIFAEAFLRKRDLVATKSSSRAVLTLLDEKINSPLALPRATYEDV